MRKIILYSILLPFILVSCSDNDDGPSCPTGYFGEDCETPFNEAFIGTWDVEQLCSTSGSEEYTIQLEPSTEDPQEFIITGMWEEASESITVLIQKNNRLKLTPGNQPLGNSGFNIQIVSGEINKAGNEMQIEYIIYSGPTQVESCSINTTRQF